MEGGIKINELIETIKNDIIKKYNILKPIKVKIINKKKFKETINSISLEEYGIEEIEDDFTDGYLHISDYAYTIYLSADKITPYTISVFTHELGHIITYPRISFKLIINSKNSNVLLGYYFFRELAATYIGYKIFKQYGGSLNFIYDKTNFIKNVNNYINSIYTHNDICSLYELIAIINLSQFEVNNNQIKEILKLCNYCNILLEKKNIRVVTIYEYKKIGESILKINPNIFI